MPRRKVTLSLALDPLHWSYGPDRKDTNEDVADIVRDALIGRIALIDTTTVRVVCGEAVRDVRIGDEE